MSIQLGMAVLIYVIADLVLVKGKESDKELKWTVAMYITLLFIVYPIAFSPTEGYFNIGDFKLKFFVVFTPGFLISTAILLIKNNIWGKDRPVLSLLDKAVLFFCLFSFVSFLLSGNFYKSFVGAEEWKTGLLFQLVLAAIYFFVSRFGEADRLLLRAMLLVGCFVFLIGILQRFSVNVFGLYNDVDPLGQIRFLSTIGQATWYSSYLCLVFPLGIYLFSAADVLLDKVLSTAFLVLASMSLVTQNSDSAYAAMFVILVAMTGVYLYKGDGCVRLGVAYCLMAVSVIVIGLMERGLADRFHKIDSLSVWVAQGPLPFAGIVLGLALIILGRRGGREVSRRLAKWFCVAVLLSVVVAGAFLLTGRGISSSAPETQEIGDILADYDNFDDSWGNSRGLIWKRTLELHSELPIWRKLLGIGPGMFGTYMDERTELVLDNAHNEWWTMLIEGGLFAGVAYLAIFVLAAREGIKGATGEEGASEKDAFLLTALAASIVGYVAHGMFCYQQTFTTPMVFVLIGLLVNICRKHKLL